jgi:hypothetical protein
MNAAVGFTPEKNCLLMIGRERAVQIEVVPLEHRSERRREDDRRTSGDAQLVGVTGWREGARGGSGHPSSRDVGGDGVAYSRVHARQWPLSLASRTTRGSILTRASTTRSDRHVDRSRSAPPRAPEVRAPRRLPRRRTASSPDVYARASADLEGYWAEQANTLEWIVPWERVLDWKPPHAQWFVGGKINASVNCLDRHIRTPRRNKAALVFEERPGDRRTLTYWDLYVAVNQFGNVLRSLGVKKGDRVAIYLPMIPEAVIAMLACARIGAIHSVVFGGFSPESLRDRINDSQCKVLVTSDGGYRRGQVRAAEAQRRQGAPGDAVDRARRRRAAPAGATERRGVRRDAGGTRSLVAPPHAPRAMWCEPEPMDAEDVLFILYTSARRASRRGSSTPRQATSSARRRRRASCST